MIDTKVGFLVAVAAVLAGCATIDMDSARKAYEAGDCPGAVKQLQHLSADGNPEAEAQLGHFFAHGACVPEDMGQAVHWLALAAEGGQAQAQYELAYIYSRGLGGFQDYSLAMKWFQEAAKGGISDAYADIGGLYVYGKGVPRDFSQAMDWYLKGADAGSGIADVNVGDMYFEGEGVARDPRKAFDWYARAADLNVAYGASKVGYVLFNGIGMPKDIPTAMHWYEIAAEEGDFNARLFMADVYLYGGFGFEKDEAKAEKLFEDAADHEIMTFDQESEEFRAIISAHRIYPPDAVKAHKEGAVTVEFGIKDNKAVNVEVDKTSGNSSLDKAAVTAVRNSLFPGRAPYLLNITHFVVILNFDLGDTSPGTPPRFCSQANPCLDG